ncbi:MAG TPA: 50S ribosomal protein L25 [Acidimicrobiales bacterium]|nr:50S ribosomal protein L25 [Acidimicrobiales bacterium]
MPEITLNAQTGRKAGTRPSGRLRAAGQIPGVIYGHGIEPIPVAVDGRELRSALSSDAGLNALLSLKVDGTSHLAMARVIQRHPVRHTVVHVDFQVVRRDEVISADVPVHLVGEAEAVQRDDGVVDQQLHTLSVKATPDRIPHAIEVDISALEVGSTIRVGDLRLAQGVSTDVDPDQAVVVGQPPQAAAEAAAIEEAAAEALAEAAAETPEGAEAAGEEVVEASAEGGEAADGAAESSDEG